MGVIVATREVTLHLPTAVYEQVQKVVERIHRPVADVVADALTAAAPILAKPEEGAAALAQLAFLNDAALWQAARATMQPKQRDRLALLHDKQQRKGLSVPEQEEERLLLKLYRETILVRAQAAVLLQQRG